MLIMIIMIASRAGCQGMHGRETRQRGVGRGYHSRVLLAESPKEDVGQLMPVARLVGHMLQDSLHVLLLGRPMIARRGLYTGFADRVELEGGLQTAM